MMKTLDALAAIRQLDALPEVRRRYLAVLAADAPSVSDRARIVMMAQRENIEVRYATERAVNAELNSRARWAEDHPERPAEAPQKATGGRRWAEEGVSYPGPRSVTVRHVEPTKTATEKQTRERRPLMGQNKKYADKQVPVPTEPKPRKQAPEHGLTGYAKRGCRCDICRAAKAESRRKRGLRNPNGVTAKHGTISRYSNNRCRCEECRAAAAEYARGWRERQRSGISPQ